MQRPFPIPLEDFSLKETAPRIGGGRLGGGDKFTNTYDLVEQMQYLYVRVVKAKDLPHKDVTGSCDPYVEVKLGNYKGTTQYFEKNMNPEWNQVFAFSKERIQAGVVEVVVKDKDFVKDDFIGMVFFDLNEAPKRVPPDSPLAPQWYRLADRKGEKVKGELMLAIWMGTQADEAFPEAWHSDAASVHGDGLASTKSKVYLSPKLWYLRVNVIEAQGLLLNPKPGFPEVFVKVNLGGQIERTKFSSSRSANPLWNEDLMLVAAEPFEEALIISVEERIGPNKDEVLGKVAILLQKVERRLDCRVVSSKWCHLEKKEVKLASCIHLRLSLDGGYHVLDEATHYSSDLRPTAKELWKPSIGILQLGIRNAQDLSSKKTKDGRDIPNAYCVAKYGHKWVRTRTIIGSSNPKWNEQYTWEVFDPCTVITIGVFDNCQLQGREKANGASDNRIGKVRIRLSTLETDKVYSHSYPLLVLHTSGVIKMGEVQLAVRFSSSSLLDMLHTYGRPLLPKMHYLHPLTPRQLIYLRHQSTQIVAMRLSRAEPPLRKEVVQYMLDVSHHMWSMRRSNANFYRIKSVFSGLFATGKWFSEICLWKNPITTVLIHILFVILVLYPELILPTMFLYLFLIGVWHYRGRPKKPPHMDARLSYADTAHPNELDEEFDSEPSTRPPEVIRARYDRLRRIAGKGQALAGDLATQGERLQSLLSWRDPRATALFLIFCLAAALVFYVTPFQVVALLTGFYVLRHPRFRHKLPSVAFNFFKRLPSKTDSML